MQKLAKGNNYSEKGETPGKKFTDEVDYNEEQQPEYESTISSDDTEWAESRVLTHVEAGECLHTLGKCVTAYDHAYLGLNASNRGLTDVSVIPSFRHVRYVNVSGNRLTLDVLRALETLPYLQILQADRNRLTSAELKPMPYLQELTMNQNRLTDTSGIHHKSLEHLEMNRNDIRTVTMDPRILVNLKTLDLRGNALTCTAGIHCSSLVRLFLAENQIEKIEGLEVLVNLKMLHLRSNKLANLDGFSERCRNLNYVNLRNNKLSRISELRKLSYLPNLEIIIILENPFLKEEEEKEEKERKKAYRPIVLTMLPKLKRIDKNLVLDQERDEAKKLLKKKIESNFEDFDLKD